MATTIRIAFILLTFGCCCHLNEHLSSYFTFSYQDKPQDSRAIAEFQADTELACALRCNRKKNCDEAVFRRAFKKCSLYQKKEKGSNGPNERENNKRSGILTMIKVRKKTCKFKYTMIKLVPFSRKNYILSRKRQIQL